MLGKNLWQNLKKPIIGLAPMDGVTDFPLREIQAEIAKPSILYTEFISVEGFSRAREKFLPKLKFSPKQRPIIAQLVGYTPRLFEKALREIILLGFDGVDINMGCPDKSLVRKNAGAALIENYRLSEKIITACLKTISKNGNNLSLSVKTRIAKDDKVTREWFAYLSSFPLNEITIHGRTKEQKLNGNVNWERVKIGAEIAQKKGIIILGNGGVNCLKKAKEICQEYNLEGILIGQKALGNPWIFKNNYSPSKEEILTVILKHGRLAWDFYGKEEFHNILKHFGWYPKGFADCKKLRVKLLQVKNVNEAQSILKKFGLREE